MTIEKEISKRLESAWEKMRQDPKLVMEQAENILKEIQIYKNKSTAYLSSAFVLLELRSLHLLAHSYFIMNNVQRARDTAITLIDFANKVNSIEYRALAEHVIGKIEVAEAKYEYAKNRLTAILPILEEVGNHYYIQAVLIDLSHIELIRNRYNESINYLLKAESNYLEHPINPRVSGVIMASMINAYSRIGNFAKIEEYAQKTLQQFKEDNDILGYSNALLQISNIYSRQGDTAKQIDALNESIRLLSHQELDRNIAIRRLALGGAYLTIEDFENSLLQFQEALPILTQSNDTKNVAILHHRMGILYSHPSFGQRNSDIAQRHFLLAEQIAVEMSMPHFQVAVLESRAESYASFGLFEEAFTVLQRSTSLEKQILNEKSIEQLRELEVRYDVALKEKENELLAANIKVLELQRNNLESQLAIINKSLLVQMNEIKAFRSDLISITKQLDKAENILRKVKMKLRESPLMQESWESYLEVFAKVHPNFQSTLLERYPDLTVMETKICILIKAGLKSEEISEILSLSARTIENHRFHLRKKLGLPERANLSSFLLGI